HRAPTARSRSATGSLTRRSDHSATPILSSPTSRPRAANCSNVESQSVRSVTRCPRARGMDISHPGSTLGVGTTQVSPTSRTPMAIVGCCRNGAIARVVNHRDAGGPEGPHRTTRQKGSLMSTVTFRKVDVDGIKIFYREAGPTDAPTILLLHGFPT